MRLATEVTAELLKDERVAAEFDTVMREEIGAALRDARTRCGLSQEVVAQRMGVSRPRVSQIESTEGHQISIGVLARFASAIGWDLDISIRSLDDAEEAVIVYVPAGHPASYEVVSDYHQPILGVLKSEYLGSLESYLPQAA